VSYLGTIFKHCRLSSQDEPIADVGLSDHCSSGDGTAKAVSDQHERLGDTNVTCVLPKLQQLCQLEDHGDLVRKLVGVSRCTEAELHVSIACRPCLFDLVLTLMNCLLRPDRRRRLSNLVRWRSQRSCTSPVGSLDASSFCRISGHGWPEVRYRGTFLLRLWENTMFQR